VAAPDGGYQTLASTDMAAALTAGVAALIRGRYPWLTAAEVTRAIEDGATAPSAGPAGSDAASPGATTGRGRGALNAGKALAGAAALAAAHPRLAPAAPTPTPTPTTRPAAVAAPTHPAAAVRAGDPGGALRSVLLDLLVAACVLIAGLIGALTVTWLRRRRRAARADDAARDGRGRGPGRHSRAQPPPPVLALQRPPDLGLPRTPPRAAIGAGSAWVSANPSVRPSAGRPADGPLPPWEQSPSVFASAPAPKAPPPWPLSSTGPMYVWNPAATTGPLPLVEEEDQAP
jgi:hypothetical protein